MGIASIHFLVVFIACLLIRARVSILLVGRGALVLLGVLVRVRDGLSSAPRLRRGRLVELDVRRLLVADCYTRSVGQIAPALSRIEMSWRSRYANRPRDTTGAPLVWFRRLRL